MPPKKQKNEPHVLTISGWEDYELLDSGAGAKLERYGPYTFVRPEHQAVWRRTLPPEQWQAAHAVFRTTGGESGGDWQFYQPIPRSWQMRYKNLIFQAHASESRHMGVFPEQASHWDWIQNRIQNAHQEDSTQPFRVLNLFAYTGLATLAAAQAGAHVTHVDASKGAVNTARTNQALSGLDKYPIRWLVDDAVKFVEREIRRGSTYEGLILDPPKFGRGPKGRVWEFSKSLPHLLDRCRRLLSPSAHFFVITAYAVPTSPQQLDHLCAQIFKGLGGTRQAGRLAIIERSAGRRLYTSIFVRWTEQNI